MLYFAVIVAISVLSARGRERRIFSGGNGIVLIAMTVSSVTGRFRIAFIGGRDYLRVGLVR